MNSRKMFLFFLSLANITGLVYLLSLAYLNLPAQDDYAFLTYMRDYGFNSSFTYWYSHWQARFTAHYVINTQWILLFHHVPLFFFHLVEIILAAYGVYNLIKNALAYIKVSVTWHKWSLLNAACFIVVMSIYSNFEFNTFYWLNVSAMYVGGVLFFILGFSEILSPSKKPHSYLIAIFSFLYMGASSENFAFVGISLTGLFVLLILWVTPKTTFGDYFKMPVLQKAFLSIAFAFGAFLIMVTAPGNMVRMEVINQINQGHKTVPLPLSVLPYEALKSYILLLILVFSKLPILISVMPVFAVVCFASFPVSKDYLTKAVFAVFLFILLMFVFVLPTVYATGGLGPSRSLTYLIFLLFFLAFYVAFLVGNIYSALAKGLTYVSILVLFMWSVIFVRDFFVQFPEIKKYNQSELNRLKYLSDLKSRNTTDLVILDALYTPRFPSYTNKFRNEVMDIVRKHKLMQLSYCEIDYSPLFYNEITIDSAFYVNTDMQKALELKFPIKLKP